MIKKITKALLLLILIGPLVADAALHHNDLAWDASPDPGVKYDVYKAPGVCPASGIPTGAVRIATGLTVTTYPDAASTLTAGQINCYYVIATLSGASSPPSNTAPATTPVGAASNCRVVSSQ
jgi:hypothetical protein